MSRKGGGAKRPPDSRIKLISPGPLCGPFATQGRSYRFMRAQVRSRTQNNVAPATAAGIISTLTPGIISAR